MVYSVKIDVYVDSTKLQSTVYNYNIKVSSDPSEGFSEATQTAVSGSTTFDGLYFIIAGNFKIAAKDNEDCSSFSDQITIKNTIPKISFIGAAVSNIQPCNTESIFGVFIEIYNDDLTIKYAEGAYVVNVYMDSLSTVFISGTTFEGILALTLLSISIEGTHKLKSSSSYFLDSYTQDFTIYDIYLCLSLGSTIVIII